MSVYKAWPHSGVQRFGKSRVSVCVCVDVCVFVSICSSESAGIDNANHHNVSDGGDDGDPEPDGIAGHGLRLILLAVHRGGRGSGVDAGRGVEERVFTAVIVIG